MNYDYLLNKLAPFIGMAFVILMMIGIYFWEERKKLPAKRKRG